MPGSDGLHCAVGLLTRGALMRRLLVPFALLALLLVPVLHAPPMTLAADIPKLSGTITDRTGELDRNDPRIQPALDRLQRDHGVQLFVLFVDSTDDLSVTDYASRSPHGTRSG